MTRKKRATGDWYSMRRIQPSKTLKLNARLELVLVAEGYDSFVLCCRSASKEDRLHMKVKTK